MFSVSFFSIFTLSKLRLLFRKCNPARARAMAQIRVIWHCEIFDTTPASGRYNGKQCNGLRRVCINHAPAATAALASVRTTNRHTGRTGLNIQHAPAVKTPTIKVLVYRRLMTDTRPYWRRTGMGFFFFICQKAIFCCFFLFIFVGIVRRVQFLGILLSQKNARIVLTELTNTTVILKDADNTDNGN